MEEKKIASNCDVSDVRPIMMALPYPPQQVTERNSNYAGLLSVNYCGAVSELSAITQYINYENRLACQCCPAAKTILGIAMAEMIHLQKIGELIFLLGGSIEFTAKQQNGQRKFWTAQYLKMPENNNVKTMALAGIDSERAAIGQYQMHCKMIKDPYIQAVLSRIIKDEEYHIMLLQELAKEEKA